MKSRYPAPPQLRNGGPIDLVRCPTLQNDKHHERKERGTFEQGCDDDHAGLQLAGNFRLTGHAFESCRTDLADTQFCLDQLDTIKFVLTSSIQ